MISGIISIPPYFLCSILTFGLEVVTVQLPIIITFTLGGIAIIYLPDSIANF